ncbi:MAG: (2Fe-2S) ferredoxin domain-containing protein [Candidatus Omnitrophica bacterium]|nr:(2Fe-2S) ferredoxin domain-containing protein [Candidatus Omnitrophota bacterium]
MGITRQDLDKLKEAAGKRVPKDWIRVGYSTCGVAAGADVVYSVLVEEVKARGLNLDVKKCGCVGLCSAEPLVEVNVEGVPHVFYGKVTKDVAHKIMDEHVSQKKLVENHIYEL